MRIRTTLLVCATAASAVGCQAKGTEAVSTTSNTTQALAYDSHDDQGAPTTAWTDADEDVVAPKWKGTNDEGSIFAPLFRGAFPGMEENVWTPPDGDCTKTKGTVRVTWSKTANTVAYAIKVKNAPIRPNIRRIEGVNWWFNAFHPAPKDFDSAGLRLWTILGSVTRLASYYYDPTTLKIFGSEFDTPNPPAGTIIHKFPIFAITGARLFFPDNNGYAHHEYTVPYDHVTNEGQVFARAWASFTPQDLCEALPFQPDKSQLRPYISPWQDVSTAPSWDQMLNAGLAFDMHLDSPVDVQLGGYSSYVYSGYSFISNNVAMQGGVPNGWHAEIIAAIRNVTPPISQVQGGGNGPACTPYVNEPRPSAPRYCELPH